MATVTSFDAMLNEYLTYDLLKEEFMKRDYLLSKIDKDTGWKVGAPLIVPFKAAGASSIAFGGLTASNDVSEDKPVRGQISRHAEAWGTLLFQHKDLMLHDGSGISEKTFLRILPDAVEDFMDFMKMSVSVMLLNGKHFAKVVDATNAATGVIVVDRPDRFTINQKVYKEGGAVFGYVSSIDMNASEVHLTAARNGAGGAANLAGITKCYMEGAETQGFSSLKEALLPASVGGSSQLYGVSKLQYPYLQAIAVDGSGVTASNVLSKIFDALVTIRQKGKGNPTEVVMSYKWLGNVLKLLETSKGAFNIEPGSQKVSTYGWTEISVGSVKGAIKLVGIQEVDDDCIMFIDWRALKFHSLGTMFQKRTAPDGKQYYEQRAQTGYSYLLDLSLMGDLVVSRPSYCGILHSIP